MLLSSQGSRFVLFQCAEIEEKALLFSDLPFCCLLFTIELRLLTCNIYTQLCSLAIESVIGAQRVVTGSDKC